MTRYTENQTRIIVTPALVPKPTTQHQSHPLFLLYLIKQFTQVRESSLLDYPLTPPPLDSGFVFSVKLLCIYNGTYGPCKNKASWCFSREGTEGTWISFLMGVNVGTIDARFRFRNGNRSGMIPFCAGIWTGNGIKNITIEWNRIWNRNRWFQPWNQNRNQGFGIWAYLYQGFWVGIGIGMESIENWLK